MKPTTLVATRRLINAPAFDPATFISNQVDTLSTTTGGIPSEELLCQLFDDLFHHLDGLAQEIEKEVVTLQESAWSMESALFQDLDDQYEKLTDVSKHVDHVKESFDHTSEGAVRVGGRLTISDRERANIEKSLELLSFVQYFEDASDDLFGNILAINSQKLRESLPGDLPTKDWGSISQVFYSLRIIAPYDPDTKSVTLRKANKLIDSLGGVVEMELLGQFDAALNDLMQDPENAVSVEKARGLAESLYLFNGGVALQKRYIFGVIQRRIPNDAFFRQDRDKSLMTKVRDFANQFKPAPPPGSVAAAAAAAAAANGTNGLTNGNTFIGGRHQQQGDGDESSEGYSDEDDEGQTAPMPTQVFHTKGEEQSLQLIDLLSGLFQMINTVCIEQFALIRKIFPVNTIPQVTRSLIQRIFSDPAFGIQARVDAILYPPEPSPKLPLADYLDALLTVREKLTALNLLLLECAADPVMRGMGSEGESVRRAKKAPLVVSGRQSREGTIGGGDGNAEGGTFGSKLADDEEMEEQMRSDMEIREFFEEQIAQVLGGYVSDYFDKELLHTRSQYGNLLRRAVDDSPSLGRVSGGTLMQIPQLRAEKMKTISLLVKTVANRTFLNSIFTVTTDAVLRMESIGRDDRKLYNSLKDLFMLQLNFLSDGLMIPWAKACTNFLLKICSTKAANSSLPPMDLLPAVTSLIYGKNQIKIHFEDTFMRSLTSSPNLVVVCKEARRNTFKMLMNSVRECLHAWTLGVAFHIDKLLGSLQSKYDYAPKFDAITNLLNNPQKSGGVCTPACDAVCKVIIQVTNAIRNYESQLIGVDMNTLFWKPFGSQCIGNLISHLRKQKITLEGSKVLMRDIQEYKHVMAMMNSPDAMDMMSCLEEICAIFSVNGEDVAQMVINDFRHLDSSIVLSLVRARSDFNSRGNKESEHWTKVLSSAFMNYKWDTPLVWEAKKPFTVMAFSESLQSGQSMRQLGPNSLRKVSGSMSALFKTEMMRNSTNGRPNSVAVTRKRSGSGAIALDVAALESEDAEYHIRAAETDYEISRQTESLQKGRVVSSKFLPSRPDDVLAENSGKGGNDSSTPSAAVMRPDLIMTSKSSNSSGRSISVDRAASNATIGIASNGLGRKNSNSSSASNLLPSSSMDGVSTPPQRINPLIAARKSTTTISSSGEPVDRTTRISSADSGQQKAPKTMFTKMSSFFAHNTK